mgnify:CR=1 FL=1
MSREHLGLNRYICTVLEEMRKCIETLNFSILPSLIEEAQILANRMEAKLMDVKDLDIVRDQIKQQKNVLKELKNE